ncbi:MAG: hypothetical protein HYV40_00765 [Candidatus Levybacteria bacterium]|nr:hypothetical protein [Candidatus Levybacteria bacterium]
MKKELLSKMENMEVDIIASVERNKADKVRQNALEKRVDRIEDELSLST